MQTVATEPKKILLYHTPAAATLPNGDWFLEIHACRSYAMNMMSACL